MLRGRLAEALGHDKDAQNQYKIAVESTDRAAAAEAKLLDIMLRQKRDEVSQADALRELETLSVTWRGDWIEVKALQLMARIYSETGHYGESLAAAQDRDQAAAQFRNHRGRPRTRRRRCSRSCFSARRATIFRRSTRSGCSMSFVN